MAHCPEEHKRLLAVVDPFMDSMKDDVMGKMTIAEVDELEYVKLAYMETMRKTSPAGSSSTSCMTKV